MTFLLVILILLWGVPIALSMIVGAAMVLSSTVNERMRTFLFGSAAASVCSGGRSALGV